MEPTPSDFEQLFAKLAAFTGFEEQQKFYDSEARYTYAVGAIRTGKTFSAGHKFFKKILQDFSTIKVTETEEPVTYWCVAPNYEDTIAQKIVLLSLIPDWMIDHQKQGSSEQWKDVKRGGGKLCLIGNRLITFKSLDNPEAVRASKIRGVWWTEIARSKYSAWSTVSGRLANYADSWLIADTSPYGHCWFYHDVWQKRHEQDWAEGFLWTAVDSPYVPQEQIDQARASLPEEFFKRDWEASWSTFQGQIYSTFSRDIHMVDVCPFQPENYWISVDLNTSDTAPHHYSLHVSGGRSRGQTGEIDLRLHKLSEHQLNCGLDYQRYADELQRLAKTCPIRPKLILDPSAHTQFKTMLSQRDLTWYNGNNAVLPGIRNLGGALQYKYRLDGKPLYTIDKNCNLTASEFEGYHWKRSAKGVVVEVPDKESFDPHLLDGDRYLSHKIWSGYQPLRIR